MGEHTGAVDEHVDASVGIDRGSYDLVGCRVGRDVGDNGDGPRERSGDLGHAVMVAVDEYQRGPELGEPPGGRLADTVAGTGHDDASAGEVEQIGPRGRAHRDRTLAVITREPPEDRVGGGQNGLGHIGNGVELGVGQMVDEQLPHRGEMARRRRRDLGSTLSGDRHERAAPIRGTALLGDEAPLRHTGDMMREPALLPAQLSAQLDGPHPTIGLLGEVHEHGIVRVRQGRLGRKPPSDLAVDTPFAVSEITIESTPWRRR